MAGFTVRVHKKGEVVEHKVEAGTNLLRLLRKNSINISAPCGGKGSCGKCRAVINGVNEQPGGREEKLLGRKAIDKGYRLACYIKVDSDIDVYLDGNKEEAAILTETVNREIKLHPLVSKELSPIQPPGIEDQAPDLERIMNYAGISKASNMISILRELPDTLRQEKFNVTLIRQHKKLIGVEPGDTTGRLFGIGFDIGTTTIAAYLVDLRTGRRVDVLSTLNPQRQYGADVISRIQYTMDVPDGLSRLNEVVIASINDIIGSFTQRNGISKSDIYAVVFAGNTTMSHILMKIPVEYMATSPFIPVTTHIHEFGAEEIGIDISSCGRIFILPGVSAYVGSDTVAAVLSSGMYEDKSTTLLVDIGTNGEIVLKRGKHMYSCSTAAGPAFEGAHIRNGIGGVKGAIDKVKFSEDLEIGTIGNEKPVGICGSGIVDIVAGLLAQGVIDETGRLLSTEEELKGMRKGITSRLSEIDGIKSFLLVPAEKCGIETDISITQKDIREIQNAKAAIAAGIKVLVKKAGIKLEDVDKVLLAGGFGSYINVESALKIGLLPREFNGKIKSIGNAAGAGTVEVLLSSKLLKKTTHIKSGVEYIELSACSEFTDEYVECMMFE